MNELRMGLGLGLLVLAVCSAAQAQVYRCEVDGKVTFTDDPCLGGARVEVVPTQGLDSLSGKSMKGADVRRNERNRAVDQALRPLTGKAHEEMEVMRRRSTNRLTPEERLKCQLMDGRIANLEAQERNTQGEERTRAQAQLLEQRKSHRQLNC